MADTNFWFYTLNAIPQTLAAMITLAATFVIFKLSLLSEKIKDSREDLLRFIVILSSNEKNEIHNIDPLSNKEFLSQYEEGLASIKSNEENLGLRTEIYVRLQAEMQRIIHDNWRSFFTANSERVHGYLTMKRDKFSTLLLIRNKSLRLLRWSLSITALTIIASLIALPSYSYFESRYMVIGVLLFASTICVVMTVFSVWTIAED